MDTNRKGRRYLLSNKNKNKMNVTKAQELAYAEAVQQAPVEEVKITDAK